MRRIAFLFVGIFVAAVSSGCAGPAVAGFAAQAVQKGGSTPVTQPREQQLVRALQAEDCKPEQMAEAVQQANLLLEAGRASGPEAAINRIRAENPEWFGPGADDSSGGDS